MASNLRVDSIVPATGTNVSIGTATGGVNIPGVLTYEDVTNVDSLGIVTARSGISCTGVITATQNSSNIGIDLHATSSGRGSQIKLHKDHLLYHLILPQKKYHDHYVI